MGNYICTRCAATLDAGETKCPICGGRAVYSTWSPGYSGGRRRRSAEPQRTKTEVRNMIFRVLRKSDDKVVLETYDPQEALAVTYDGKGLYMKEVLKIAR